MIVFLREYSHGKKGFKRVFVFLDKTTGEKKQLRGVNQMTKEHVFNSAFKDFEKFIIKILRIK